MAARTEFPPMWGSVQRGELTWWIDDELIHLYRFANKWYWDSFLSELHAENEVVHPSPEAALRELNEALLHAGLPMHLALA